jgi:hypothetical protein
VAVPREKSFYSREIESAARIALGCAHDSSSAYQRTLIGDWLQRQGALRRLALWIRSALTGLPRAG